MRLKMKNGLILCLVAAVSLLFVGCLDTKRKIGVSYNSATDEFHVLRLYYHIRAENDGDVAYLASLYANRDHLILYDPIAIINENASVRVSANQYLAITLGQPTASPIIPAGEKAGAPTPVSGTVPAPETTTLDLSKVKIEPGTFFLSPEKTVCYYQQMAVPGSFIDKILEQGNTMMRQGIAEPIQAEQKRRQEGGASSTWEDLRKQMISTLDEQGATTAPAAEPGKEPKTLSLQDNPLQYLSAESLKILVDSVQDKSLGLSRKGPVFTLTIKVSPNDAKEFKATIDLLKKELMTRIAKQADLQLKKQLDAGLQAAALLNISDPKDGVIAISVDGVKAVDLARTLMETEQVWEKPDEEKAAQYPVVVDGLKQRHIPVDEKLQLADIVATFKKAQLPVSKPEKTVTPGEGLFSTAAAPETQPK